MRTFLSKYMDHIEITTMYFGRRLNNLGQIIRLRYEFFVLDSFGSKTWRENE